MTRDRGGEFRVWRADMQDEDIWHILRLYCRQNLSQRKYKKEKKKKNTEVGDNFLLIYIKLILLQRNKLIVQLRHQTEPAQSDMSWRAHVAVDSGEGENGWIPPVKQNACKQCKDQGNKHISTDYIQETLSFKSELLSERIFVNGIRLENTTKAKSLICKTQTIL